MDYMDLDFCCVKKAVKLTHSLGKCRNHLGPLLETWIYCNQCATFPIDRGPDLGKNWVGLANMCFTF